MGSFKALVSQDVNFRPCWWYTNEPQIDSGQLRKKKVCTSLDSVHTGRFPQPGAQPRNIKMNGQPRAHIHNLNALTGCTRHQVDRSMAHAWLPQSHSLVPKRGKAASIPLLMKYGVCLFGLVELTAQVYRENGPRPISVQRRAVAASIWNNPPAALDEWRNPRRAAVARLRGPT